MLPIWHVKLLRVLLSTSSTPIPFGLVRLAAQVPTLGVTCVTVKPASPTGMLKVSVTTTPAAADGPLLRNEST